MQELCPVPLRCLAHARSGDKGDIANIAVFAYDAQFYDTLVQQLTAARIQEHYGAMFRGPVRRYEVANLHALNFVCEGALGGGVSRSLRLDNYGKSLAAAILAVPILLSREQLTAVDARLLAAAGVHLPPY